MLTRLELELVILLRNLSFFFFKMAFIVIQNTKTRKLSGTGIDCVWLIIIKKNPTYMEKSYILDVFPFTEICRIYFYINFFTKLHLKPKFVRTKLPHYRITKLKTFNLHNNIR